jgi:hypothetical protein
METVRTFLTKHTARRWATAGGKCANTSFTPAPVAHPLPTPEKSRRTTCKTAPTTHTTKGTPTTELTSQQAHPTNPIQARKRIAHFYQQTQNSCKTAQRCHTAPHLVRKGGNATNNTAYAHPRRCQSHLRQGRARHRTLGLPAQAPPLLLPVDFP